jgi:G3E family GTPase
MSLIPTTILTGFLGSGKTTLLKRVLTEAHGQKIAVIENEFGEENIDSDILVSDTNEQIIQMSNGCICCTETYLLDSILTLVDAKHAAQQLNDRQEARRQVGFADQIFISKADLVSPEELDALKHRLKHMNPRAPQKVVHFGEVALSEVFDLKGFNLNAKLDIDPDFLKEDDHDHVHGEDCDHPSHQHEQAHDHEHGEHCDHPSHQHDAAHGQGQHHHHDDDVKSFVFRSDKAFDPAKLEDFLGAIVNIYGPRMLRYKGVLNMRGTERKVIFQGVHQLMGSDLGPMWADGEAKMSKMVFIGIDLPKDILLQGLEQCLV